MFWVATYKTKCLVQSLSAGWFMLHYNIKILKPWKVVNKFAFEHVWEPWSIRSISLLYDFFWQYYNMPFSVTGIPSNVPEFVAAQCSHRSDHVRQDGAGPRVGLWRLFKELRVQRYKGSNGQTNTGIYWIGIRVPRYLDIYSN